MAVVYVHNILTSTIGTLHNQYFDVSLLSIEDGIFEVKATAGDTHLGGEVSVQTEQFTTCEKLLTNSTSRATKIMRPITSPSPHHGRPH